MYNTDVVFIIGGFFYLFIISFTVFTVYKGICYFADIRKAKRAYALFIEGYEAVTVNSKGIPVFMKKGGNYEKV